MCSFPTSSPARRERGRAAARAGQPAAEPHARSSCPRRAGCKGLCRRPGRRCAMTVAAILFTLTALGGLLLAGIRLKGEPYPPLWLALGHGAGGAAGFAALGYAWSSD